MKASTKSSWSMSLAMPNPSIENAITFLKRTTLGLLAAALILAPGCAEDSTARRARAHTPKPAELREITVGRCITRVFSHPKHGDDVLIVTAGADTVFRVDDMMRLRIAESVLDDSAKFSTGADVSGDGVSDLIVTGWNGGMHCCFTTWILSMGDTFQVLAAIDGRHSEAIFRQMDSDPELEVEVVDWAFEYWPVSFVNSPSVKVALDWSANRLAPSTALTAALQPAITDLEAAARKLRSHKGWHAENEHPYEAVFSRALELHYSGRPDLAASFVESAWGGTRARMTQAMTEFRELLDKSAYYGALERARSGAGRARTPKR